MAFLLYLKAIFIGIVEGLTEFLPISSTGHLIIASDLLGFETANRATFLIAIQTAAILAVCWEYRKRLFHMAFSILKDRTEQRLALNIVIGTVPAVILGLLFKDVIEQKLFNPVVVACMFILGGIVLILIERRKDAPVRVDNMDSMTWKDALKIGLAQCFALIPGTSRAGASIVGALLCGHSRRAATEFSFFLALPMIFGATVLSVWSSRETFMNDTNLGLFAVASVAAFFSALACVRWFLKFIGTHDFTGLGWYRIGFGCVILLTAFTGWVDWSQPL